MTTNNNNAAGNNKGNNKANEQKGQVLVVSAAGLEEKKPDAKEVKTEVKAEEKPDVKPELSNLTVVPKPEVKEEVKKPLPTIAERLKKLEEFNDLVERRETLIDAIGKLSNFFISDTGSCNVKLTDSRNNSFGISHPIIIGEMVYMATEKLQKELAEVEAKINFSF